MLPQVLFPHRFCHACKNDAYKKHGSLFNPWLYPCGAYLNVPIIGVALFGLVAALIYINKSSEAVKEAAYDDNEF